MRAKLLRRITTLLTVVGVAAGMLTLATAPAQASSFGVSISASTTTITVGQTVTFTGTVTPRPSSRYVYLQRRFVGSTAWKTVKTIKASSGGSYKVTVGASSDADRYYRVYKPRQGSRKAGRSVAVQVIVDPVAVAPPATLTGLDPAVGPLAGGTTLTVSGAGLTGTTRVTFTPKVPAAYTADGSGVLPELAGQVTAVTDDAVTVVTPASLGGTSLVKVYTPSSTLTTTYTFTATNREPSELEQAILDEVNVRRATTQTCHGGGSTTIMPAVPAVAWTGTLSDLALSHSRDLAARQDVYGGLSHVTYGTASFTNRFQLAGVTGAYGEILALSPDDYSATQVVDQWITSKTGHCEALMKGTFTKAGVGLANGLWQTSYGPQNSTFSNVDFQ